MNASFWEHLEELRWVLLKASGVVLFASLVVFLCYPIIYDWITEPIHPNVIEERVENHRFTNPTTNSVTFQLPHNKKQITLAPNQSVVMQISTPVDQLTIFGPIDGMLTTLKMSLWTGIALSSPIWLILLLQFVAPALKPAEKRVAITIVIGLVISFCIGVLFAWKCSLPLASEALRSFNSNIGTNLWGVRQYLEFSLSLLVAHGLTFELMAGLLYLVHSGAISPQWLSAQRRKVVVGILIFAAILTPPDIITQTLLALPMIGFYELIILYGRLRPQRT